LCTVVAVYRLCGRKGGGTQARDIGELLQLRQHMGHLIGNLQVYLQLDVIESNYDWLLGQLAAAQVSQQIVCMLAAPLRLHLVTAHVLGWAVLCSYKVHIC
jgi:hypothetical protein